MLVEIKNIWTCKVGIHVQNICAPNGKQNNQPKISEANPAWGECIGGKKNVIDLEDKMNQFNPLMFVDNTCTKFTMEIKI